MALKTPARPMRDNATFRQVWNQTRTQNTQHFLCHCGLAIDKCPPVRNRAEGHQRDRPLSQERFSYCLSYTAVLLYFLPCGSVPLAVAVRVLPSADTTARPVIVTFPPFLRVNARV